MTLFFALLAVAAEVAAAALLVSLVLRRRHVVDAVRPSALPLALLVAAVATAGSLYLSEVANFVPCTLCWYQRIAMYPLVPLTAVALWRRQGPLVGPYMLALAVPGAAVSLFHVLVERFPDLDGGVCTAGVPCSFIWVERLGYLTIPTMALSGFVLIAVLALILPSPAKEARS
jgi:disulfide bond formation protein DsbB